MVQTTKILWKCQGAAFDILANQELEKMYDSELKILRLEYPMDLSNVKIKY